MRTIGKLHLLKLYLPTAPNAGWSWLLKRGRGREGREGGGGERDEGEKEIDFILCVYASVACTHMY